MRSRQPPRPTDAFGRRTRLLTHHCLLIDADPSPRPKLMPRDERSPPTICFTSQADFEIRLP
jgi:hypothetical protein